MKKYDLLNRRNFLACTGALGAGLLLSGGCAVNRSFAAQKAFPNEGEGHMKIEVTAIEDLMREHGILRRILFVYSEAAGKLRQTSASSVEPEPAKSLYEPLHEAAKLFRDFGENYHEKALEENYIFPAISKIPGEIAALSEILITQHKRGMEITDYVLAATNGSGKDIQRLTSVIETFVRMYRAHTAREDTIVFPAWKQTLDSQQYHEMSEKFEEIEHKQFGEEGFNSIVSQITAIEKQLNLYDLSQFTPKAIAI
jgi:hemerythrin-like domain-containing protein